MSNDTTRILDLPDNGHFASNHSFNQSSTQPSYAPIDIHPNPYGHPPPSVPSLPTPSNDVFEQQQRLPSRDMHVDPTLYTQDEKVHANYIPQESNHKTSDYIKSYDEAITKKVIEHEKEKRRQERWDKIVEEGQIPLLISVLFFLFRMPIVETYLKKMPFIQLESDGHFTLSSLFIISGLFGCTFHSISNFVEYLSEF